MRRRALAVIALACCVLATGAASARSGSVPRTFYGVVPYTPPTSSDYRRMDKARVGTVRLQFYWPAIQASRNGPFDWSATDKSMRLASLHHLTVLPILFGSPGFETGGCTTHGCSVHIHIGSAAQQQDWQAFVTAAVQRYGPFGQFWASHPGLPSDPITEWQIWNEQNGPFARNSAKTYAQLLSLAQSAIHGVDPSARIILGGMFGTPRGSAAKTTAWGYLASLYKNGAGGDFDAVALHPYSPTISGLKLQVKKIRKVMRHNHDSSTPLLITEIGWGSSKKKHPGTGRRGAAFNVGAKLQKKNLTRSFKLLTSHRRSWKIGGVYWFTWKDPKHPPPGLCAFCYSSGLYKANGRTAKPALHAFERFTRNTSG